jgi:molybdopterin-guanine dinucleotide biosynthesis protein A
MPEVSAWVLAGGRSRRMGRDKAQIVLEGETLLARALRLARSVTPVVAIVGPREVYGAVAPVVEDVFPGQGPLAGIHAALRASATDLNLVLAVDTPLLTPEFLQYLARRANASGAVVTVPRTREGERDHLHSLCAVYRRKFAAAAQVALEKGQNRIDALFGGVPTLVLESDELEGLGFAAALFRNLNAPDDLEDL